MAPQVTDSKSSESQLSLEKINPLVPKPNEQIFGFFRDRKMKKLQMITCLDLDKILSPEKVQGHISTINYQLSKKVNNC